MTSENEGRFPPHLQEHFGHTASMDPRPREEGVD
jgi:hypothetical protein